VEGKRSKGDERSNLLGNSRRSKLPKALARNRPRGNIKKLHGEPKEKGGKRWKPIKCKKRALQKRDISGSRNSLVVTFRIRNQKGRQKTFGDYDTQRKKIELLGHSKILTAHKSLKVRGNKGRSKITALEVKPGIIRGGTVEPVTKKERLVPKNQPDGEGRRRQIASERGGGVLETSSVGKLQ